jgi:hypothetical protein
MNHSLLAIAITVVELLLLRLTDSLLLSLSYTAFND